MEIKKFEAHVVLVDEYGNVEGHYDTKAEAWQEELQEIEDGGS